MKALYSQDTTQESSNVPALPYPCLYDTFTILSTVWTFGIIGQWNLCLTNLVNEQYPPKEKLTYKESSFLYAEGIPCPLNEGMNKIRNGKSRTTNMLQRLKKMVQKTNPIYLGLISKSYLSKVSRRKGKRGKTAKAETTTKSSKSSKSKERRIPAKIKLQSNQFHKHLCSRKRGMKSFHWFF